VDATEVTWPLDPSLNTLVFRPRGYLVVILADTNDGERAHTALEGSGYAPRDLKLYTAEEILANFDRYRRTRTVASKIAGAVTDDIEGRDTYLAYARERRSALWVRIPHDRDVAKALRVLADHRPLHTRYYGENRQDDVRIRDGSHDSPAER
jgi:hypothetical protein